MMLRVLLLVAMSAGAALAGDLPPGLTASSSLDRPAIWVADRVVFTVEITCPAGFDILVDDLARDRLKLTGFEVIGSDMSRSAVGDATRYVFHYLLTTYKVDVPAPGVAPFPVRYYVSRTGQRPDEAAPAGSIVVPAASVAFRSLLQDDQPSEVRDGRTVPPRWAPYRFLELAGIGLIVLSLGPIAIVVLGVVRRSREDRDRAARPSARQVRNAARASLDEIHGIDPSDVAARRDGFGRLEAAIRHHVADVCDVGTAGLTPEEVPEALAACNGRLPVELVASILATCERARYASPAQQPSADDWHRVLDQAAQVLAAAK